jgi:hypothetical protein
MRLSIFVTVGTVVLVVGCATVQYPSVTQYLVHIDSLRGDTFQDRRTFSLFSGKEGVEATDLQFQEFANYVRNALTVLGYVEAQDPTKAGIAVFLNYGIGDPQTTYYSYSYPVFGVTGGGTTTFDASVSGAGGTSHISGVATQPFQIGVVGTKTRTESRTTYLRYIVIEAISVVSFTEKQQLIPVWKTTITSSGASSDLRVVFPILLAASQPHIASDTGKRIDVWVEVDDPSIWKVRDKR